MLRPFLWWGILVLVLFLLRTHQRLSERTSLWFEPTLAGRQVGYESSVALGEQRISSGDRVTIGWHTLTITHPKTRSFTTNLFLWYGQRQLGKIPLTRATGTLALETKPAARLLTVRGPEFTTNLNDSVGLKQTVPTDSYAVEAQFKHLAQRVVVEVRDGVTAAHQFAPSLGDVAVTCNQTEATFELLTSDARSLERGTVPTTLTEIPEGNYRLVLQHHGNRVEQAVMVRAGVTNEARVEFQYGALALETEPSGAAVLRDDERVGVTPLVLTELLAGNRTFMLARDNYEPAVVVVKVTANQTNRFQTNLVSRRYSEAMRVARDQFAAGRYDAAAEAAGEALKHKSDDPAAKALLRGATGLSHLSRARLKSERGDFAGGIVELNAALELLPDNADAKALLADLTRHEEDRLAAEKKLAAEQAERERKRQEAELAERKAEAKIKELHEAFNILLRGFPDGDKFQEQELTTAKTVGSAGEAIKEAFTGGEPSFKIVQFEQPRSDLFALQARQAVGIGYRDCFVVGSRVRDAETRILFKVLEYDQPPRLNLLGGLITGGVTFQNDSNRAAKFQEQIKEGAPMVRQRIRRAVQSL